MVAVREDGGLLERMGGMLMRCVCEELIVRMRVNLRRCVCVLEDHECVCVGKDV